MSDKNQCKLTHVKTDRLLTESKMIYKTLGNSGLKVSVLGFGNWVTGHNAEALKTQKEIMLKAWESGVNFFDTAETYGAGQAEKIFGEFFKELDAKRSDLVITTKLFWGNDKTINQVGNSRKHLFEGMKQSLNNLQLDYVDIVYSHRPDFETPLKEICKGFNDLIDKGYAFYWGTSEWLPEMIARAIEICDKYGWHCPIAEQCQYSMLCREGLEKRYTYIIDEYKYGSTIFSPLCFGILTGKYNDGIPEDSRFKKDEGIKKRIHGMYLEGDKKEETLKKLQALGDIAKEKNVTMAQLALAWCLTNKDATVSIMGASKVSQVEDNLKSLELAKNWDEDLETKVNKILANAPEPQRNFTTWKYTPERRSIIWKKL